MKVTVLEAYVLLEELHDAFWIHGFDDVMFTFLFLRYYEARVFLGSFMSLDFKLILHDSVNGDDWSCSCFSVDFSVVDDVSVTVFSGFIS